MRWAVLALRVRSCVRGAALIHKVTPIIVELVKPLVAGEKPPVAKVSAFLCVVLVWWTVVERAWTLQKMSFTAGLAVDLVPLWPLVTKARAFVQAAKVCVVSLVSIF